MYVHIMIPIENEIVLYDIISTNFIGKYIRIIFDICYGLKIHEQNCQRLLTNHKMF